IRDLLQQYLEVSGYTVAVATNGLEALAEIRKSGEHIALVLLDRNMETMDGTIFLDSLLGDPVLAAKKIPIVMMSAGTQPAESRAVAFIKKPFNFPELLALVARFVPSP
ncbi:MAG: response regulator, partial [Proteobacteria bacterium]